MTDTKVSVNFELPTKLGLYRKLHPVAVEKRKWHRKSTQDFRSKVSLDVAACFEDCAASGPLVLDPADTHRLMDTLRVELFHYGLSLEDPDPRLIWSNTTHGTQNKECLLEMTLELTVV